MQRIGFDISGAGAFLTTKRWLLQRTFNWQLLMPDNIGGVIGYLVSQYCQDVEFGDYSIRDIVTMRYGAFQRFYAGLQQIDEVTVTFLMPTDGTVIDYFYGWFDLIVDKKGYYYPKNNYKKNIYVILYDRTGVESVKFKLKGVFPRTRPRIRLSFGEDNVTRLTIGLSVDNIELESSFGAFGPAAPVAKGLLGRAVKKLFR